MVVVFEENLTGLLGPDRFTTFGFLKLGDGEVGNLRTLKNADAAHEDEKYNNGDFGRDEVPHSGLSVKESSQSDSEGKCEKSKGH